MKTTSSSQTRSLDQMSIELKQRYLTKTLIWLDLRLKLLRKHIQEQRVCADLCSAERIKLKDYHLLERSEFYGQLGTNQRDWFTLIVRHSKDMTDLSIKNQVNRQNLLIRQTKEERHLEELIAFQEQLYELHRKVFPACHKT